VSFGLFRRSFPRHRGFYSFEGKDREGDARSAYCAKYFSVMPTRINVEIADRVNALINLLEAESERDAGAFSGSPEERLLFALRAARADYLDARRTASSSRPPS